MHVTLDSALVLLNKPWSFVNARAHVQFAYNYDTLGVVDPEAHLHVLEYHKVVVKEPYMVATEYDNRRGPLLETNGSLYRTHPKRRLLLTIDRNEAEQFEQEDLWVGWYKNFIPPTEEPKEPISDLLYPIIDNMADQVRARSDPGYNVANHKVVGLLAGSIYWRSWMRNILPDDSNGIRVVISNPCSNAFTYKIQGPSVVYLGVGDHHEEKYDKHGKTKLLSELSGYTKNDQLHRSIPSTAPLRFTSIRRMKCGPFTPRTIPSCLPSQSWPFFRSCLLSFTRLIKRWRGVK